MKKLIKRISAPVLLALVYAGPVFAQYKLNNPLGTADPRAIAANVISVFLGMVGVIALIFIIWGGFTLLTSGGNQEKVKKGRDTLFWAALGLVIVFASYGITQAIFQGIAGQAIT